MKNQKRYRFDFFDILGLLFSFPVLGANLEKFYQRMTGIDLPDYTGVGFGWCLLGIFTIWWIIVNAKEYE